MTRHKKEETVAELQKLFNEPGALVVTHYAGLKTAQLDAVRRRLAKDGGRFKITKNSLARRAIRSTPLKELEPLFKGPAAVAWTGDPAAAPKTVADFSKEHEALTIIGGAIDGNSLQPAEIRQIAALPSLKQLRGKIIGLLQAPSTKIAVILSAPASQISRLLLLQAQNKDNPKDNPQGDKNV